MNLIDSHSLTNLLSDGCKRFSNLVSKLFIRLSNGLFVYLSAFLFVITSQFVLVFSCTCFVSHSLG